MSEEIRTTLKEVEEKLVILAYETQDGLTVEQKRYIRKAWANVYALLVGRV